MPVYRYFSPDLPTADPVDDSGWVSRALSRGLAQTRAGFTDAARLATDLVGAEEASKALDASASRDLELAHSLPRSFANIESTEGFGEALQYLTEGAIESAPFLATTLATRGLGGRIGKSLGAANRGRTAGTFAGVAAPETGFTYRELQDETGQQMPGRALVAGGIKGALDTFSLGKNLQAFNRAGRPSIVGEIARGAGREGVTESLQELTDIGAVRSTREDPFTALTPDEFSRALNAGAIGAFAGGVMTGVGAGVNRVLNPDTSEQESFNALQQAFMSGRPMFASQGSGWSLEDIEREFFGGNQTVRDQSEVGDLTEFQVEETPEGVIYSKRGMPWPSVQLMTTEAESRLGPLEKPREDTLGKQFEKLVMEDPAARAIAKTMIEDGATDQEVRDFMIDRAGYVRRSYLDVVRDRARREGLPINTLIQEEASKLTEAYPQHRVASRSSPEEFLQQFEVIVKETNPDQRFGGSEFEFTEDELLGWVNEEKDDLSTPEKTRQAKQGRAILRKPAKGNRPRHGEIILRVTRNGKEQQRALNPFRLVVSMLNRTDWKEGQTLTDRIAEAFYTGLASVANSKYFDDIDLSRFGGERTNVEMPVVDPESGQKDMFDTKTVPRVLKGIGEMSQAQKEKIVVFSIKNERTGERRDWTLAELERTGAESKLARARGLARRTNEAEERLKLLSDVVARLDQIPEEMLRQVGGDIQNVNDLMNEYEQLHQEFPNLLDQLAEAEREYVRAKQAEEQRLEADRKREEFLEQTDDIADYMDVQVGDRITIEIDGKTLPAREVLGTAATITSVPKEPIQRSEKKLESLFNFKIRDELFEQNRNIEDEPELAPGLFRYFELMTEIRRLLTSTTELSNEALTKTYEKLIGKAPDFPPKREWLLKVTDQKISWAKEKLQGMRETNQKEFDERVKDIYSSRSVYPSSKSVAPNMNDSEVVGSSEWSYYTGLVNKILKSLGMSAMNIEVLKPSEAYEQAMATGQWDHAAGVLNGNLFGFVQMKADGSGYYLYVNPFMAQQDVHTTLAHEVGHLIHFMTLQGKAHEDVIRQEYMRYLQSIDEDTTTIRELLAKRRAYRVQDAARKGIDPSGTLAMEEYGAKDFAYLTNFYEWFADRAMTRLLDRRPPRSAFERILVGMLNKLRQLFRMTQPHDTVEEYVDSLLGKTKAFWGGAVAPVTYFQQTPFSPQQAAPEEGDEARPTNEQLWASIDEYLKRTIGRPISQFRRELLTQTALLSGVDAFGAAFHESFKQALNERIIDVHERALIGRVVMGGRVQRQLMFLLRHHPEARQLAATSPTDAIAYAYQFWMTGQLNLDPRPDTIFRRIADFFRELFGIVAESANAEFMFEQFVSGRALLRRNEPSDNHFVMRVATRDTRLQRAMQDFVIPKWESFWDNKMLRSIFSAANVRMHRTGNPVLQTLANMMFARVDSEGMPTDMFSARIAHLSKFHNEIRDAMKGHEDDLEFGQEVVAWLNSGKAADVNSSNEVERVAAEIRRVLTEIRNYMVASGLRVGYIENYFPWVFDTDYLADHRQEFIDLMSAPNFAESFAENGLTPADLYARLMSSSGSPDQPINLEEIGHIPALSAKQARTMGWIDELATPEQREQFGAFLSTNLGLTLNTYIEQAVKRAEYHKRFGGNKLNSMLDEAVKYGASEADLELAKAFVDAVMGTHGYKTNQKLHDMLGMAPPPPGEIVNPKLQRLMGIMMVYQNVRTLALSTLTSVADIVGIAVRTGDISMTYGAMKAGMKQLYANAKGDESVLIDMAEMLGTIDRHLTIEALNWEYGGVYMTGPERKINELFFRGIGLQAWTRATRVMALEAAQRFLKRHKENPNQHSERYFAELGITPEDIEFNEDGTVKIMPTSEQFAKQARVRQLENHIDVKYAQGRISRVEVVNALKEKEWTSVPSGYLINQLDKDHSVEDMADIQMELFERGFDADSIVATKELNRLRSELAKVESRIGEIENNMRGLEAELDLMIERGDVDAEAIRFLQETLATYQARLAETAQEHEALMGRIFEAEQEAAEEGRRTDLNVSGTEIAEEHLQLQQDLDRDERSRSALNRWVDGSILRPNATLRPIWASDPHWMLFFHLKSFMYAFHERIIKRIVREAGEGNMMPMLMSGLFIPAMMMLDYLRDLIQHLGEDDPQKVNWDWDDHALEAVQRSGMLGLGMLAVDAGQNIKMGGWGYESFAGPTYQQLEDILLNEDYELEEAVPGANIIKYWVD